MRRVLSHKTTSDSKPDSGAQQCRVRAYHRQFTTLRDGHTRRMRLAASSSASMVDRMTAEASKVRVLVRPPRQRGRASTGRPNIFCLSPAAATSVLAPGFVHHRIKGFLCSDVDLKAADMAGRIGYVQKAADGQSWGFLIFDAQDRACLSTWASAVGTTRIGRRGKRKACW